MICGYLGRLLVVDLSAGRWDVVTLSPDYVRGYLGGRGLGARYLFDLLPPGVDPLSAANVALLMTGPLTGTEAYACHKYEWITKSPLTGSYLCSNSGGMLGVGLRRAGYDGVAVTGACERPAYLYIDARGVEVRDASALWGRTVAQTQALLRQSLPAEVATGCIGPAAELPAPVRFAGFFDGQRSAGRGGLGAVLGAKRLKAVVVAPGDAEVPVWDPAGLRRLLPEMARRLKEDRVAGDAVSAVGTMVWVDLLAHMGLLPARNYQAVVTYPEIRGRLNSAVYAAHFTQGPGTGPDPSRATCHRCPVRSARLCVPDREGAWGKNLKGPEFQSAWALGPNCGVLDFRPIIAGYAACNEHGVDTISLGGTIGFAMECWQRRLLDRERIARDYDGLRLEWGNCESVLRMVAVVAERRGWLGELLADGVRAAAARLPGSSGFALHVKGMEFPSYDPRGAWSLALAYATGCRGACHLKSWTLDAEYGRGGSDPVSAEGKAAMVIAAEDLRAVIDSALVCTFASSALTEEWMTALVRAVTGLDLAEEGIAAWGARICDLERRLALREGVCAADDCLPPRVLEEPLSGGDYAGVRIGQASFQGMLAEYYSRRGWDPNGIPQGCASP
ncbi:MAG: aldehyde ferredoxin oxidoreductase family protein [Candidatus Latescibacterota bacterium]